MKIIIIYNLLLLIFYRIMGCTSPSNSGSHNIPAHHLNRLLQVSQITHPLNVNKKYEHLAKIQMSKQVGTGYRRTNAYHALATKQQIDAKRKQFWQTRVNGPLHIWEAIKKSIQMKDETAGMNLLNQHQLILLNGSIQMCVDNKFNKYQVPVFCINQPISYSKLKLDDKNLNFEYEDKKVQITIRSAKYPNGDLKLNDKVSAQVQIIKGTIRALKQLPSSTKIRLFYNGREMKDDKTLGNYNYSTGTVIQAMII